MIIILCDQRDCTHCIGGHTAHDYSWEWRCNNSNKITLSLTEGCQSKTLTEQACRLQLLQNKSLKEVDMSIRAMNALAAIQVTTIGDLFNLYKNKHRLMRTRNIGSFTRKEIESILREHKLINLF